MTRRNQDDGERGRAGVVLSVLRNDEGFEVTVDSVRLVRPTSLEESRERFWAHDTFVHFMQLPPLVSSKPFSFTEEQLAAFGLTILGSIYAEARALETEV